MRRSIQTSGLPALFALGLVGMLPACSAQYTGVDFRNIESNRGFTTLSVPLVDCETHVAVGSQSFSLSQPHATIPYRISILMNACEENPDASFAVDSAFIIATGRRYLSTTNLSQDTSWVLALRGEANVAIDGRLLPKPTFRQINYRSIDLPWEVDTIRVVYFVAQSDMASGDAE